MIHRIPARRFLAAPTAVFTLLVAASAAFAQEDFRWEGQMERGDVLQVKNIVGDVIATPSSGNRVEVVAVKQGRERDFDRVAVEFVETRDGMEFCVRYGERGRGGDPCDSDRRDDRRDRNRSIDVSVEFEVRVPAGVTFEGSTVTGNIEAVDLRSDVRATSVTGDVTVSTTGVAEANTVTGSLDVDLSSTDWDDLHFKTVTGDITLRLPDGIDAEIEFASLSGDFDSDFDVELERQRRRLVGTRVEGTIGDGGRRLSANTVSGDLRLRRSR